jgi:hypothetical protein
MHVRNTGLSNRITDLEQLLNDENSAVNQLCVCTRRKTERHLSLAVQINGL